MSRALPPARPQSVALATASAAAALSAGDLAEGERLSAQVLKSDRFHVEAGRILAQALLRQGRPGEAVEPLSRIARRSQDPMIETLLGRAHLDSGDHGAAEAAYRKAILRRPAYPLAFLELGDLLGRLGRLDEAERVFREGLDLAPDALVLKVGLGHVHLLRRDHDGATALFAEVRAVAPGRPDALRGLAQAAFAAGRFADAADRYRELLRGQPADAAARLSLAKCLLELGQREAGEALLRQIAATGNAGAGAALAALTTASRGKAFLRPSAAMAFLAGPS